MLSKRHSFVESVCECVAFERVTSTRAAAAAAVADGVVC